MFFVFGLMNAHNEANNVVKLL